MTTPAERMEAIRGRCKQAALGPWEFNEMTHGGERLPTGFFSLYDKNRDELCMGLDDVDADFIAHAREDIPYLLARVGELEEAALAVIDFYETNVGPFPERLTAQPPGDE